MNSVNTKEIRPWGWFEILLDQTQYKVKRLYLKPNHQFSLQYHQHREEHWVIVCGSGTYTMGKSDFKAFPGRYIYVPIKELHRMKAGSDGIIFIETQIGGCDEDDIIRISDDYGR
jgi:mannose-1-phosphate guanylyltransferase